MFRYFPCETDDQVGSFVQSASLNEDPTSIRSTLTQDDIYTLRWFCFRRALQSLQEADPTPVLEGFKALELMTVKRVDRFDPEGTIAILCHAARHVGIDLAHQLALTQHRADPEMGLLIARCSGFPLRLVGYREIKMSWGIGLSVILDDVYWPTLDLMPIVERVIKIVEDDDYDVRKIVTGFVPMPRVWFPQADEAAQSAFTHALAGVSVDCSPNARGNKRSEQLFNVWIGETASAQGASDIASCAAQERLGVAMLGLSFESLYLIVMTRSDTANVPNGESMQSIERFRLSLQAALSA
jgi:hypothetical protein